MFLNLPLPKSALYPFLVPLRQAAAVSPFLPLSVGLWLHPCWPYLLPTPRSLCPSLAQVGLSKGGRSVLLGLTPTQLRKGGPGVDMVKTSWGGAGVQYGDSSESAS